MLKSKIGLIALFSCLTFVSGANAQFRWHIVIPDRIDTSFFGFSNVSCHGENCTAVGVTYSKNSYDSCILLHSSDGGQTWISVDSVPQWSYNNQGKTHLYFDKVQQIDSLDAIAVDMSGGAIIRTFDGWRTFTQDTSLNSGYAFYNVDFSSAGEGMVSEGFGFFLTTLDTGKHWDQEIMHNDVTGTCHSYGSGTFRAFGPPNSIYTSFDDWRTIDTSLMQLSDSINSSIASPSFLVFGNGDSLEIVGTQWDSTHTDSSVMLWVSSDLGNDWSELPLPSIYMNPQVITPFDQNPIVIAGVDSAGRVLMSANHGETWQADTVPLDDGESYYWIQSVAVTQSGRVIAIIAPDDDSLGSNLVAYLEPVPSSVNAPDISQQNFSIFPNPTTVKIQITSSEEKISILDPLGRSYEVKQTGNTIDISSLPSGVYFVSDGKRRAKFVKE